MNKREASQYLGKTERAVERYTQAGELSVKYKPGKTRPVADYDETELRELKHRLANPSEVRPAVVSETPTKADQTRPTSTQALQRAGGEQGISMLASVLADALRAAQASGDGRHDTTPPVELKDKLMLTEKEAAAYAGLSLADIERARDPLKTIKTGAGWRVKRTALEAYVKRL
jgi:hypothetical protein